MAIEVQGIKFYSEHELVSCILAAHRIGTSNHSRDHKYIKNDRAQQVVEDVNLVHTVSGIDIFEDVREELVCTTQK